ncbi:MAG: carbon monoxide dehydrogenase, partial [Actinomycetota bacterium]
AVGQRVMASVAKRTAAEFFGNVDDVLAGRRSTAVTSTDTETGAAGVAGTTTPVSYSAPSAPPGERKIDAMVAGALIALLGVLVGRFLGPRRR